LELFSGVDTETEYEVWQLTQKAPNDGWASWQMLPIPNFPDLEKDYLFRAIGANRMGAWRRLA
jgi:hypothetical protein